MMCACCGGELHFRFWWAIAWSCRFMSHQIRSSQKPGLDVIGLKYEMFQEMHREHEFAVECTRSHLVHSLLLQTFGGIKKSHRPYSRSDRGKNSTNFVAAKLHLFFFHQSESEKERLVALYWCIMGWRDEFHGTVTLVWRDWISGYRVWQSCWYWINFFSLTLFDFLDDRAHHDVFDRWHSARNSVVQSNNLHVIGLFNSS